MKKGLTILLFVSLVSLAIFGFSAIGSNHHGLGFANCLIALTKGIDCGSEVGSLAMIFFHVNTLQEIFNVNFINYLSLLLSILLIGLVVLFAIKGYLTSLVLALTSNQKVVQKNSFLTKIYKKDFTRWTALHENSPSSIF